MMNKKTQKTNKAKSYKKQVSTKSKKFNYANYYEMQLKLKDLQYKLLNCKLSACNELFKLDLLITEVKAFIFNNDILKTEYLNRVKIFYNKTKTNEYKEKANSTYKLLIKLIEEKVKEQKRKINYSYKDDFFPFLNVCVSDKLNKLRFFSDEPLYYIYPSLIAPYSELTGIMYANSDFSHLSIMPNIRFFYLQLNNEFDKLALLLPDDIDFYISISNIQNDTSTFSDVIFNAYFIASSLCYVLSELNNFLNLQIKNKYYKMDEPIKNQIDINNLKYKNETLYKLILAVNKNQKATRKELAALLNVKDTTIDKKCQKICELLKVPNGTSKGITTVREIAKNFITN